MDFRRTLTAFGVLLLSATGVALARPNVTLHLEAFVVQGQTQTPLGDRKLAAGDRVRFILEAHNAGTSNALHLTPSDPIPAHMSYVAGSARDGNSTVEFSLDGTHFSARPTIKIKTAKGSVSKPADPSLYRAIRWVTHVPLPANHTFTYSYEAQVNGLKKGAK